MSRGRPHGPMPYSKVANLVEDSRHLQVELEILDRFPGLLTGQHAVRRWEYAMALRTITSWYQEVARDYLEKRTPGPYTVGLGGPLDLMDVGGAGAVFWQPLGTLTTQPVFRIDPRFGTPDLPADEPGNVVNFSGTVERLAAVGRHGWVDCLTAISVIEHVEEVRPFLRACHMLLKPAGLLFLTMDYWDAEGPDVAHFHWMRQRIYNASRVKRLAEGLRELGYRSFGQADWRYHGPQVYEYSVASLAMVKK